MTEREIMFRLRHETKGGHVHCALFAGPHEGALGNCGTFVMRVEEFGQFAQLVATAVEFRPRMSLAPAPLWAAGRALAAIPEHRYLAMLRQEPEGWDAKIADKITDVDWTAFEKPTAAEAIMAAIRMSNYHDGSVEKI